MRLHALAAVGGSRRYSAALFVDALGAGLLRPFMLLYGLRVLGLGLAPTGAALTVGLLVGLAAIPLTGRWIDRSGGRSPVIGALLIRAAGVAVLLAADSLGTFVAAAVLLSCGTQAWPPAHAALVSAMVGGRDRDVALSAGRAVRNAGLGAGALIATVTLAGGAGALRGLAVVSGVGFVVAGALVRSVRPSSGTATGARAAREPAAAGRDAARARDAARGVPVLFVGNLPFALMFDVLEVALPAVFLQQLGTGAAWPGAAFIGNTVLVVTLSVPLVVRLAHRSRRSVFGMSGIAFAAAYLGFLGAGTLGGLGGAVGVALFSVVYTLAEILYSGTGTALVIAAAPPGRLGRALARFELSSGLGKALAPAVLTTLFGVAPAALWIPLAAVTGLAGLAVARFGPQDPPAPAAPAAPAAPVDPVDPAEPTTRMDTAPRPGQATPVEPAPRPGPVGSIEPAPQAGQPTSFEPGSAPRPARATSST
ncbi:MFS transporter [Longispora sp. K20-0274]|uniref:MFS transporter n=1 Tax=Longispora sp. K20-0274 TaxID=3088255 RepID=UPI00399C34C8